MIKNRSFMTGLGFGLLAGAIILQLMLLGRGGVSEQGLPAKAEVTKESLQQQAESMNLKLVDPEDKLMTEEEWKQQMISQSAVPKGDGVKAPDAGNSAQKPVQPSQPENPGRSGQSADAPVSAAEAGSPEAPSAPVVQTIELQIKSGNNLEDVAGKLKKSGVISDANQFIQKGRSMKISTKIQTGKYSFTAGEDLSSIITKITTKPSS